MLLNSNVPSFQPTLAPQTFEPRLGHLPTEILLVIIELVARFVPRELEIIGDEKSKHLVWQQDLGATKSVWTYRQPDCPILNSLQALSVVNKRLNYLCRSVLWRVSYCINSYLRHDNPPKAADFNKHLQLSGPSFSVFTSYRNVSLGWIDA